MTGKEICEAAVRNTWADLDDAEVSRRARMYWDASPNGELWHVFQLAMLSPQQQRERLSKWFSRCLNT